MTDFDYNTVGRKNCRRPGGLLSSFYSAGSCSSRMLNTV
ncbi:hypothetical protein SXCC_04218 [Gluconacetobacter sp. SXCC-1]|nr:hypothetical protein SXCC_04218 [Gluconacetobacter sp. SXCC-1]